MDAFSFGFGSGFCFLSLMCGISLLSGFLLFDRLSIPIRCHFFPLVFHIICLLALLMLNYRGCGGNN